jgi:GNAT superfamily N-acetyltransferase
LRPRFRALEALAKQRSIGRDLDALEALWQEVKAKQGGIPTRSDVALVRVRGALPSGFRAMQAEAHAEGHGMLDKLADEWEARDTRFDREGEALLAAYLDDSLAGVGGLTLEPAIPGVFRMRRFYVSTSYRRSGIGRKLAMELLAPAIRAGRTVTANAAAGSDPFWEALGFVPDRRDGHTHILRPAATQSTSKR